MCHSTVHSKKHYMQTLSSVTAWHCVLSSTGCFINPRSEDCKTSSMRVGSQGRNGGRGSSAWHRVITSSLITRSDIIYPWDVLAIPSISLVLPRASSWQVMSLPVMQIKMIWWHFLPFYLAATVGKSGQPEAWCRKFIYGVRTGSPNKFLRQCFST